jgi:Ran GTPase-activating protein (RanGAP) involved in mRNA processing and transport
LEAISLAANQLYFNSIQRIASSLGSNKNLERLSLQDNMLGSDSVLRLMSAGARHSCLRKVDLRGICIASSTAARVRERLRTHQLEIAVDDNFADGKPIVNDLGRAEMENWNPFF